MKKTCCCLAALTCMATGARAGGLDRTYTPIDVIWEKGNYAEFSFGYTSPDLTGRDALGNSISDVADSYSVVGGAIKYQFNDRFSVAVIFDQPYGADISYGGSPASTLLGGTSADADSNAITALLKFQPTERVSLYGGPRVVRVHGDVTLSGLAYSVVNGYEVDFDRDTGYGYVVGAAYEIPDIALRASLTYHSSIDISLRTTETIPVAAGGPGVPVEFGNTRTKLPKVVTLDLQSGIAKDTLLFGSIRWSEWGDFTLVPPGLQINISENDDIVTYELGVGRRFTEKFTASLAVLYEDNRGNTLVSPLSPPHGFTAVQLGGRYQLNETVTLSGGIRYTSFGDSRPETGTPDVERARFRNNDAISLGLKVGFSF